MNRYLKYYINTNYSLDSVVCVEGEPLCEPKDFVEWFNKDDWEYVPPEKSLTPDGYMNGFGGRFRRKHDLV